MAKISVIGAGIGGMSAAARLAKMVMKLQFLKTVNDLAESAERNGLEILHSIPVHHS